MGLTGIQCLSLVGVGLCVYTIYLEGRTNEDQDYQATCDISDEISCTKVFKSSYSHILSHFELVARDSDYDISNAYVGMAFYVCSFLLPFLTPLSLSFRRTIQLLAATGAASFCVYLAYILKFILHNFW